MKHLKKFETNSAFDEFKAGDQYILPNVSFVVANKHVSFDPYVPPTPINLCDVAYWDGTKVRTCALDSYDESLGTAVGVVVIPSNFLPDGKARMIALKQSNASMFWGIYGEDVLDLVNYNRLPITDNTGSTATDSNSTGYLPSDRLTGSQSFVDPIAKYGATSNLIPSPYLSDGTLNPEYMKTIDGYNNALSDFDGKGNTDIIIGLGSKYAAANHAKDYTIDGASGIDWYLPAAGELGILMARLGGINTVISTLGGVTVPVHYDAVLWSSSEYIPQSVYCIYTTKGNMSYCTKEGVKQYVRSFAIID